MIYINYKICFIIRILFYFMMIIFLPLYFFSSGDRGHQSLALAVLDYQ